MTLTPNPATVAKVSAVFQNAHDIVSAYNHVGRDAAVSFDLAACCAMVQQESGGRMIWGADPWDRAAYPKGLALPVELQEQPVTEADYHVYRGRRNAGMQPQGCGIAQLTSPSLQVAAEHAGGCWVPFYNARVGFQFLRGLFAHHGGPVAGFAAYNGSGPAAQAYGERVAALRSEWLVRLQ